MGNFRDLGLDRSKIVETLENNGYTVEIELNNTNQKNYSITNKLSQNFLLTVYSKEKGKTDLATLIHT